MNRTKPAHLADVQKKTIGELVAEDYRTAAVFERLGIDFCCGGRVPWADACRQIGVDPVTVCQEIEAVKATPLERDQNYSAWELPLLADHIIRTHHAFLNENTGQIAAYARKIAAVHGAHHPEVIEIAAIFDQIAADMAGHLREEEEVLFPAVKRIVSARKAGREPEPQDRLVLKDSLDKLDQEHEAIGAATHAIRRLARGYEIPADVCNTFAVTYRKLQEFEDDLHQHVHLENNILFPKAAQLG